MREQPGVCHVSDIDDEGSMIDITSTWRTLRNAGKNFGITSPRGGHCMTVDGQRRENVRERHLNEGGRQGESVRAFADRQKNRRADGTNQGLKTADLSVDPA